MFRVVLGCELLLIVVVFAVYGWLLLRFGSWLLCWFVFSLVHLVSLVCGCLDSIH